MSEHEQDDPGADELRQSTEGGDGSEGYARLPASALKALRQQAKAAKQAEAKIAEANERAKAAEEALAFQQAGIHRSDPKSSYFVEAYSGEMSPSAIREAAAAAGISCDSQIPVEELAAHGRMINAGSGAEGSFVAEPSLIDRINKAETQEEVMSLLEAANTSGEFKGKLPTTWRGY